ncbi:MAG: zinc ribbon domain-containing protein [Candidatus Koribacter versatilis]|uniref:Zinc ribbon domain-containing protein n=1 Tax=Candidatus Korobacter versatilis TaxID=658062 RepID=A0A932A9P5_9BACT|nr:zinc ribbon domain-containing protein [Candidatus Koribacter versatilis]
MDKLESDFSKELKIIPWWSYLLGSIAFLCMQFVFHVAILHSEKVPPPPAVRSLLGVVTGLALAVWFMLLGYVNRDAGRRGMNRALWTFLVIIIPNGIGYIIYFIMRKPMQVPCPHCGASAEPGFTYCTKCGKALKPSCASCGAQMRPGDAFCPSCGKAAAPSA